MVEARTTVQTILACWLPRLILLHRLRADASLGAEICRQIRSKSHVHLGHGRNLTSLHSADADIKLLCDAVDDLPLWRYGVCPLDYRLYLLP